MKQIRFLHIPKTAGTSFQRCLSENYPGPMFAFSGDIVDDVTRYRSLEREEQQQIVLFMGHGPRITGVEEIDNLPTITFLREPIGRVMSLCQHVSEGKSPYLLEEFPPETFDLTTFLNSGNRELSNHHAAMLLGKMGYNDLTDSDAKAYADEAIDMLVNDIACFGITEYYQQSLLLFRKQLRWTRWPQEYTLNTKGKRVLSFTADQIEKIRELNSIDIQIYQAAFAIFKTQLEKRSIAIRTDFLRWRAARLPGKAKSLVPGWVKGIIRGPWAS